jgi:general stress protein YciG
MAIKDRGFASMDIERRKAIASLGGLAAHRKGTAHEWTSEEAQKAGKKGGLSSKNKKKGKLNGKAKGEP